MVKKTTKSTASRNADAPQKPATQRTKATAKTAVPRKALSTKPATHAKPATPRKPSTAKNKRRRKGQGGGVANFVKRHLPSWPVWVGAVVVVVACWLLARAFFTSPTAPAPSPYEGYAVRGIDISHHQGAVDWELLRNRATIDDHPLSFVFMKATEGTDMVDSRFDENFSRARQYGIIRGAYHFFRATLPAKQQAEHFIRRVRLEPGDLPPVLDVEVHPEGITAEDFRQGILEWLVRVEQHYGVRPILYTYHSFRQQYMNDSVFNLYPYWIAHYYVDSVRYRGPWAFWQHSDRGDLPGIRGDVDLDIFRGTYDELRALTLQPK